MSIEIKTVKTESFSMDWFSFGHGKKTMVILPGLSVQSVMGLAGLVAEAYKMFADDHTVYMFDRRKELPASYSIKEMAEDTAAAIRSLGLGDIDLLGASQGGMIAMQMAVDEPDLVHKLVLCSTSSQVGEEQFRVIGKWIDTAKKGDREGLYMAFGEAVYPPDVFEKSKKALSAAAKTVTDEDLERFVILADMKDFDITEELRRITCPVLVLGSMDDQVLGCEPSFRIAANLGRKKGLVLHMYDGYGHAAYDLAPDYKDNILRFLSGDQA